MLVGNLLQESLQFAGGLALAPDNTLVVTDIQKQVVERVQVMPNMVGKVHKIKTYTIYISFRTCGLVHASIRHSYSSFHFCLDLNLL